MTPPWMLISIMFLLFFEPFPYLIIRKIKHLFVQFYISKTCSVHLSLWKRMIFLPLMLVFLFGLSESYYHRKWGNYYVECKSVITLTCDDDDIFCTEKTYSVRVRGKTHIRFTNLYYNKNLDITSDSLIEDCAPSPQKKVKKRNILTKNLVE